MRDYAKISPRFWVGPTGKEIRKMGQTAQVVALYLLSGPHANLLGLYYLPIFYIAGDTGIPTDEVLIAIEGLAAKGFCSYDHNAEMVWVHEMARYQCLDNGGDGLKPADNRVKAIRKELANQPATQLKDSFFEKYAVLLCFLEPCSTSRETPSKPLLDGSSSQEQEQKQEEEQDAILKSSAPAPPDAVYAPEISPEGDFYLTKKRRELRGKRLEAFNRFWKAFGYAKGKAEAADVWLEIPQLKDSLVEQIVAAAAREARERPKTVARGGTPKFPQGWLSARRWEDNPEPTLPNLAEARAFVEKYGENNIATQRQALETFCHSKGLDFTAYLAHIMPGGAEC